MDAALELFAAEGYSHCSISQLAKHTGISKGLMYNYFRSKEDLLMHLIEDGIREMMSLIDPNQDGVLEPEEVESFIRNIFQGIRDNIRFWILFISVVLQPRVKEFLAEKPYILLMDRFGPNLMEYLEKMGFEDTMLEMLNI